MSKKQVMAEIIRHTSLSDGIFDMTLKAEEIAKEAKAGQFISVYLNNKSKILPRPISICGIDKEAGTLRIVYRTGGDGTKELSDYKEGEMVKILGPLGNGFTQKDKKAILIGGGIGIPPMLELMKQLDCDKTAVLGYRDNDMFLKDEFEAVGDVVISTEDGSFGTKGNVIDAIKEQGVEGSIIYACGPTPMLRGIKAYAEEMGIEAQISMEERMACGIGACLACVCKSKDVDSHSHVHNKRVCKDGPVFDAREVEAMKKHNEEKAKILYDFLDNSKLFKGTVVPKDRSLMNVPFVTGNEELDAKFVAEAKAAGLENLKGHRTVGGMRASIYNAMPTEGVKALVEFMKKFEEENA